MNKASILMQLENQREQLLDAIEGMDEDALTRAGVCGQWSIKEILIHISRWEAELVRLLWQAQQGARPTTLHFTMKKGQIDQVNAEFLREAAGREMPRVLEDFHAVRNQTILRVEAFADADLTNPQRYAWLDGKPLADWIANDSFGHEAEHLAQILKWKEEHK